ncbi:MAG: type IV pilus secretin PilQ [Acidobacteria bacterium]|nr:type IV pilus secretin PilQ [Acidobacteriota bacterium]
MRAKLAVALLLMAGALAVAGAPAYSQDRAPIAISDIRQESGARSTRLVVECTGPLAYTYYSPDPLTLVVDIPEVDASKIPARIDVGTPEVESLRVTTMARADGRSLARLEVRLASLVPYQIYSKDKSLNLVFERPGDVASRTLTLGPKADGKPEAKAGEPPPAPAGEAPRPQPAPAAAAATPIVEASGPSPVAPSRRAPATRILGVTHDDDAGQLAITVRADGSLKYQEFFLGNPDRLVVDFKDVVSRVPVRGLEVGQGPVRRVRLAQFSASAPKVARLVLDLSERAPYRIVEANDGVRVVFGEGQAPSPAPLAAMRPEPEPVEPAPAPPIALPEPVLPEPVLPEPQVGGPLGKEAFEARVVGAPEKKYTGDPINLDFKEGDILDIFRLFSDISGLNIVVNPGVSGRVTLKLNQVPWDQALDLILKANNLGYTREDNVVRIARLADLQREEEELRKLKENQALAGDLQVWRKSLSYAKAKDLEPTVKKVALSARGNITLDDRTNTMIITDLPRNIEKAKDLVADLDRSTPQVEIEARIVVTSRNFTRDLGIQWGFLNQQSAAFGNTTSLAFPHSIIVNGSAVPSAQGLRADQAGLAPAAGIGLAGRGYAVNLPAAGATSGIGITMGNIIGSFNLDLALTALERQGRGRLLSTPKVTTQNNREAEIKQGVQIPIQTVANNTVTVTFKDAVLTLKVTPQITEAGTVILDIDVQNNTPDFANLVQGIPPINTQAAKTIVLVRDGSTTVIGGIYQSNEQTTQNRTPFLANLPLLGYLFRNRFVTSSNNELLLFITPRIIKG